MDYRVASFFIALALVNAKENQFYKTDLTSSPGSSANFESLPFTASSGGFDFFGAESTNKPLAFSPFKEEKQGNTGFVQPIRFISPLDGQASSSNVYYSSPIKAASADREHFSSVPVRPQRPTKKDHYAGKSNYPSPRPGYKSEHSPTADFADSEDVEVFYPREKLVVLPTVNGRPKPYDGYIAASDVAVKRQKNTFKPSPRDSYSSTSIPPLVSKNDRGAQQFYPRRGGEVAAASQQQEEVEEDENESLEEEEDDDDDEEEEEPPKKSGFRYEYDEIKIPDLVIKKYPYENPKDNDREFTADYEHFRKTVPSDLEKHFGTPDYYTEKYTVAATENLAKDANCEKQDKKDGKNTCYICRNPTTGGSYEQCAYEDEPTSKKVFYGGSTSTSTNPQPKKVVYRHRRSLDFFQPSGFEYFIYNDDSQLTRKARAEQTVKPVEYSFQPTDRPVKEQTKKVTKKKKTKKYKNPGQKKKQKQRKARQQTEVDPSAYIRTPISYDGPKYTYEGPTHPYEGPSSPYEGPAAAYEGPSHDQYYDRTDDRIPYETNAPLHSIFDEDNKEDKKRPRRGPKREFEEFKFDDGYDSAYRFGPEYFDEYEEEKPDPIKRGIEEEYKATSSDTPQIDLESFTGNVKIFKNGDVCEKKKKDSMTCMVCNNEKTGATYEQCQYTSSPKSYTYGAQKSFSSNKQDPGRTQRHAKKDQTPDISDKIEKKVLITKVEKQIFGDKKEPDELVTSESRSVRSVTQMNNTKDLAVAPSDHEESNDGEDEGEGDGPVGERIEARDGIEGLDEFLGQQQKSNDNYPQAEESYDEYFKRVFPEFGNYGRLTPHSFDPFERLKDFDEDEPNEADAADFVEFEESAEESAEKPKRLKDKRSGLPEQFFAQDEETKKDLEKAYGSFTKKDWSKCKKTVKDKLTCYSCVDKEGVQNEECMYVEASEPVKSHKAYHERKDYDPAASSIKEQRNETANVTKEEESVSEAAKHSPTKGDFEGVESSKEIITNPPEVVRKIRKNRKYPIKKYDKNSTEVKDSIGSWENRNSTLVPSVVKIVGNSTKPEFT